MHVRTSVPAACGQISTNFPREGGLRILRSMPAGFTASFGVVILGPCTHVQAGTGGLQNQGGGRVAQTPTNTTQHKTTQHATHHNMEHNTTCNTTQHATQYATCNKQTNNKHIKRGLAALSWRWGAQWPITPSLLGLGWSLGWSLHFSVGGPSQGRLVQPRASLGSHWVWEGIAVQSDTRQLSFFFVLGEGPRPPHPLLARARALGGCSGGGAFFTGASRPSLLISMSAAFTGLATSAIARRPAEIQAPDHLCPVGPRSSPQFHRDAIAIVPAIHARKTRLLSKLNLESLLCQLCRTQQWIHDVCYRELHPNLSRRDADVSAHEHRSIGVHVCWLPPVSEEIALDSPERRHSSASVDKQFDDFIWRCITRTEAASDKDPEFVTRLVLSSSHRHDVVGRRCALGVALLCCRR